MITYKDAGVDIDASDELIRRISAKTRLTYTDNVLAGVGGFSSLVKIPPGLEEPVLVSGTDGVGTKLKLAFASGKHDTVGIDLVAMCVNDVVTCGAEPLFFLDYFACGKLDVDTAEQVVGGIVEGCRRAGCPLVGGETAEMPDMYDPGEYDLAGFSVGVVDRGKIITGESAAAGDAVLGLASTGLHSNGYSLARKLLLEKLELPLDGKVEELGCALYEELLRPTKIYARDVKILAATGLARSFAHITGGGLVMNAARNLPDRLAVVLKTGSWPVPKIFGFIEKNGVGKDEMLRTFNMGIGMIAVVKNGEAGACRAALEKEGIESFEIGRIEERCESDRAVRFEP
ncbi:MAG: phosphoribosylformylglycinamidine cyclo-ligase [Pseudomonadota bacterium]